MLFADDTAIYCSTLSSVDLQRLLNEDLQSARQKLAEWSQINSECLKNKVYDYWRNAKTKSPWLTAKLLIEEDSLERVQQFKYLGVVINENLDWTEHIDHIYTKIAKRLWLLNRIKYLLPRRPRELIFNSLILPILNYGDVVWWDRCNTVLMDRINSGSTKQSS